MMSRKMNVVLFFFFFFTSVNDAYDVKTHLRPTTISSKESKEVNDVLPRFSIRTDPVVENSPPVLQIMERQPTSVLIPFVSKKRQYLDRIEHDFQADPGECENEDARRDDCVEADGKLCMELLEKSYKHVQNMYKTMLPSSSPRMQFLASLLNIAADVQIELHDAVSALMSQVERQHAGYIVTDNEPKAFPSAKHKLCGVLEGQVRAFEDLARIAIVCKNKMCIEAATNALKITDDNLSGFSKAKFEDKFEDGGYEDGFRAAFFYYRHVRSGLIVEVQIQDCHIQEVADVEGHKIYEKTREISRKYPGSCNNNPDGFTAGWSPKDKHAYDKLIQASRLDVR